MKQQLLMFCTHLLTENFEKLCARCAHFYCVDCEDGLVRIFLAARACLCIMQCWSAMSTFVTNPLCLPVTARAHSEQIPIQFFHSMSMSCQMNPLWQKVAHLLHVWEEGDKTENPP